MKKLLFISMLLCTLLSASFAQWTTSNVGIENKSIRSIVTDPGTGYMYVGTTTNGIYRSTDGGATWSPRNTGIETANITSVFVSGTNIFIGTLNSGIFNSSDDGLSWVSKSNINEVNCFTVLSNVIYASTYGNGVYSSADNGTTWTSRSTGLSNKYVKSITVSGSTLFVGTEGSGVYKSVDAGLNWTVSNTGISTTFVRHMATQGGRIFAATTTGLYVSNDIGNSWVEKSVGFKTKYVKALAFDGSNTYASISSEGASHSLNSGDSWGAFNTGLANLNTEGILVKDGCLFIATNGSGVYKQLLSNIKSIALSDRLISTSALGGNLPLSISTNTNWSLSNCPSWITVSSSTGTASQNITLTASANASTLTRTATITISGTNAESQTLKITQFGTSTSIMPVLQNFTTWPSDSWLTDEGLFDWQNSTTKKLYANLSAVVGLRQAILSSPSYDLRSLTTPTLSFSWSHKYQSYNKFDAFKVQISKDGTTWNTIWEKIGSDLKSTDGVNWGYNDIFSRASIDLSSYMPMASVNFRFVATSGGGPTLYLDNIEIANANSKIASFPYLQNFNVWPLAAWDTQMGSFEWVSDNSTSVKAPFWSTSEPNIAALESPTFNLSSLTNPTLDFKWSHYLSSTDDELAIQATTDNTNWTTIWSKTKTDLDSKDGADPTSAGTFTTSSINLGSYVGATSFKLRFVGKSGYGSNLYLDDVKLYNGIKAAPIAATNAAIKTVGTSQLTLSGTVTPNNDETTVIFEYGLTTSYGSSVTSDLITCNGSAPVAMTAILDNLAANTTYHYRVKATNSQGVAYGLDQVVTTSWLNVSVNALTINSRIGEISKSFDITSNTNWTVSSNQSWLSANTGSGSNNGQIVLTATTNEDILAQRVAIVTILGNGVDTLTVEVTQLLTQSSIEIPYSQNFQIVPSIDWKSTNAGFDWSFTNGYAFVPFWNFNVPNYAYLTSKVFNFSAVIKPTLSFDWSHQYNSSYPNDMLQIEVSTNGTTWTKIWELAGINLNSNDGALNETPGTFINATVNLETFAGEPNITFRFKAVSGYGPNLYLDNITIKEATPTLIFDQRENNSSLINIYPNPNNGQFNVDLTQLNSDKLMVTVTNSLGVIVKKIDVEIGSQILTINLEDIASGLYFISISNNKVHCVKSILIK